MASSTGLPALDNTMGALFIGVIIAMALWGAGSVQVYYYFNRYPNDDYRLKLLVVLVWALDTTHQGLITHSCYTYLVTQYGNPEYLGIIVQSLLIEVLFSAFICLLVQTFLVVRVWRLSHKNIYVCVFLALLVLGEFIASLMYTIEGLPLHTYANLTKIVNLSRSINVLGAMGDVAIAIALVYLLQRSRTGFQRSETIINRIILFTINTGLLTSLCAIMSLITITVLPNTFVYIMFYVTVSRLYTNSLLATLNARKSLRGGHPDDTDNGTNSLSMGRLRGTRPVDIEGTGKVSNTHALSIKVDTETHRVNDDGSKQPPGPSDSDTDVGGDAAYYARKSNFQAV